MDKETNKKDISPIQKNDLDESSVILSSRAEKIVAAVYLVSGLIIDGDPLRQVLRNTSIDFLSFIKSNAYSENLSKEKLQNILSFLNVAFFSGFISEMNLNILKQEIDLFLLDLNRVESKKTRNFFEVSEKESNALINQEINQGEEKLGQANKSLSSGSKDRVIKDKIRPSQTEGSPVFAKKSSRRNAILEALKKAENITIKEIAAQITDCSEKTIQRELISLINEGFVIRKGERRWSLYSLAS